MFTELRFLFPRAVPRPTLRGHRAFTPLGPSSAQASSSRGLCPGVPAALHVCCDGPASRPGPSSGIAVGRTRIAAHGGEDWPAHFCRPVHDPRVRTCGRRRASVPAEAVATHTLSTTPAWLTCKTSLVLSAESVPNCRQQWGRRTGVPCQAHRTGRGVSSSPHCCVWENATCVRHCRGKKSEGRPDPLYPVISSDHVSCVPCTPM